jgi:uncharacterized surface anchored protein
MPDSRVGRGASQPWRRRLLALALAPTAVALMGVAAPAPTASPALSPAATAVLTVTKQDAITKAPLKGATFAVCVNDRNCTNPVDQMTTDTTGTAQKTLPTLPAGSQYCLRETAVPSGYLQMPTYEPASGCVAFPTDASIAVTDPPAPSPSPSATPTPTATPTPSPTPSPTPAPTGELQITKTDQGNRPITTPGFTFNIHVGSASGQVIATIATDDTGTAIAGALNPAMYCVEETSAPDGFQVAPTYSPSNCVMVASDGTQGRAPTLVTVIDPPASTPTPTAAGAGAPPSPSATPSAAAQATTPEPPSSPSAAVARGLVGIGALLLLAGIVMIVVAIRRRRQPPRPGPPPNDYWYDSRIT